jgi:hypothetical protein
MLRNRHKRLGMVMNGDADLASVQSVSENESELPLGKMALERKIWNDASLRKKTGAVKGSHRNDANPANEQIGKCHLSPALTYAKSISKPDLGCPEKPLLEPIPLACQVEASQVVEKQMRAVWPKAISSSVTLNGDTPSSKSEPPVSDGTDPVSEGSLREHTQEPNPRACALNSALRSPNLKSDILYRATRGLEASASCPDAPAPAQPFANNTLPTSAALPIDCMEYRASRPSSQILHALASYNSDARTVSQRHVHRALAPTMLCKSITSASPFSPFSTHEWSASQTSSFTARASSSSHKSAPRTSAKKSSSKSHAPLPTKATTKTTKQPPTTTATATARPLTTNKPLPRPPTPPQRHTPQTQSLKRSPAHSNPRPTTLESPRPPQPATPPEPPGPRPSELPLSVLKKDPRFKSLSRQWMGIMVGLPFALVSSWLLWARCKWNDNDSPFLLGPPFPFYRFCPSSSCPPPRPYPSFNSIQSAPPPTQKYLTSSHHPLHQRQSSSPSNANPSLSFFLRNHSVRGAQKEKGEWTGTATSTSTRKNDSCEDDIEIDKKNLQTEWSDKVWTGSFFYYFWSWETGEKKEMWSRSLIPPPPPFSSYPLSFSYPLMDYS